MTTTASSGAATVVIRECSWKACGECLMCRAREAGRNAVRKYGDALERLADG